ncbi:MAG: HlyC/CorC family transporter [Ignavibacteriales bacterium]|nr:MAG: HlyC/CorC family transporter [Ignavibacteriales bacterium]
MNYQLYEIIFFFVFIFLASYLSAAEVAIASFGSQKLEELKDKNDKTYPLFESIKLDSNTFFGTIQISTNLSLISASVLGFIIAIQIITPLFTGSDILFFNQYSKLLSSILAILVVSFLTMVFGILLPKVLGFKYSEQIGKAAIRSLILLTTLFKYPVKIVTGFSNFLLIPFKEKTSFSQTRISEDEIRILISEGVKSGSIDETEQEIIENIFEFNDLRANEVMVPRTEMVAININEDEMENAKIIIDSGHTIIPVYEESPDKIIGVIHTKDFMKTLVNGMNKPIRNLLGPVYFIPETKLISEVLKEMQNRGERIAIVTDEYGGTEGMISMEDILEEIVGELRDNTRREVKDYTILSDGKYFILGSMTIDDFNESFNKNLPYSDEYNTVAGFLADKTGKILNSGETFKYDDLNFELIKKIRQKMVQFKVYSDDESFSEKEKRE